MRTLIISDIHANLAALQTVFENVVFDRLICLGDIIGYGPQPEKCMALIADKCEIAVRGNHDESVLRARQQKALTDLNISQSRLWNLWTAEQLSDWHFKFLTAMKNQIELPEDGLKIIFAHNIRNSEYIYAESPETLFRDFAEKYPADIVFFGHSHTAFQKQVGNCLFVNTGSVGQPRQGKVEANYTILEDGNVEQFSIAYDPESTLQAMRRLPLHHEYIKLWNNFFSQGIVNQRQISETEAKIAITAKNMTEAVTC